MSKRLLSRPLGRCIGLDVHLDFIEIAICEEGQVYSAGRVSSTPEGIGTLIDSLLPTDRVALGVTGSSREIARLVGAACREGDRRFSGRYGHQPGEGADRPARCGHAGQAAVDRRASYGGAFVKWVAFMVPPVSVELRGGGGVWFSAAGATRQRPCSRRVVGLICGGWVPRGLCSSHGPPSEIERGPLVGGLLTSSSRTGCARVWRRRAVPAVESGLSGKGCGWVSVRGHGPPGGELRAETGELAGDRDRDDAVAFATGVLELAPAGV